MSDASKKADKIVLRKHIVLGSSLLATVFIAYQIWGPLSPNAVCNRTLAAIEKKDAKALLDLASSVEIKRLNITLEAVQELLDMTFWNGTSPNMSKYSIGDSDNMPVDRHEYTLLTKGTKDKLGGVIVVNDSRDNGWRLGLSWLFYSRFITNRRENPNGPGFCKVCRNIKMTGMIDSLSEYHSIDDLEKQAQIAANNK